MAAVPRRLCGRCWETSIEVFSVPSRAAIYAETGDEPYECRAPMRHIDIARASRATAGHQGGIPHFPKIREVDGSCAKPGGCSACSRCIPRSRFGGSMAQSRYRNRKEGRVSQVGIELRARLLVATGVPATIIDITLPRPVARDDLMTRSRHWWWRGRLARCEAISFPSPPETDRASGYRLRSGRDSFSLPDERFGRLALGSIIGPVSGPVQFC